VLSTNRSRRKAASQKAVLNFYTLSTASTTTTTELFIFFFSFLFFFFASAMIKKENATASSAMGFAQCPHPLFQKSGAKTFI
jgi:hypothetical protein